MEIRIDRNKDLYKSDLMGDLHLEASSTSDGRRYWFKIVNTRIIVYFSEKDWTE